jgi:hypothetical protein
MKGTPTGSSADGADRPRPGLADDAGIALVLALGVLTVLTVITVTLLGYAASAGRTVRYYDATTSAGSLAEAGLNTALAVLQNPANDATNPALLPTTTVRYVTGSATYSGTLDPSGTYWSITSTGTVKNPSGAAPASRTVGQWAAVVQDPTLSANLPWNYIYADNGGDCKLKLGGSTVFEAPLYSRGDICSGDHTVIAGPTVNAGGRIVLPKNSSVGSAAAPVEAVHAGEGCEYDGKGPFTPCTSAQHVYAAVSDAVYTSPTLPSVDLAYWYAHSMPGPMHTCTSGSFPGGFDRNTTMNGDRPDVDLFPAAAYSCKVVVNSVTVGELTWNPAANTLRVAGTIFFDGDIKPGGVNAVVYSGYGTIYGYHDITLDQDTLCGAAACDFASWNPNDAMLLFVAGHDLNVRSNAVFQGAGYAVHKFHQETGGLMQGPVIANEVEYSNGGHKKWTKLVRLPLGAPSNVPPKVSVVNGTWSDG